MSYVAIKGGGRAIAGAAAVTEYLRTAEGLASDTAEPLAIETICISYATWSIVSFPRAVYITRSLPH
jgi:hypothetical protein